jgi:hypothetical protein
MRLLYMAILDWSPNPADISAHISVIHLFFINHHLSSVPPITIHHHVYQTFLLKTSLPLPLLRRLLEGFMRRESIGRRRNSENGRRRNGLVRR